MKKLFFIFLLIISCFVGAILVKAEDISVVYNGEMLWFDVPPRMINERVMVPMRTIFETIGATVEWDEENQSVKAIDEKTVVSFKIGDDFIYTNDTRVQLDSEIIKINDRTFVPVRAIAEAFDNNVFWSSDLNRVLITDYAMIDFIGQPINLIEYFFGGDYEYAGYDQGGEGIKYTDDRVPCVFFYPYIDRNLNTKRISSITVSRFCKISNGFYGGITRNDLEKMGMHGTICSGQFSGYWEYRNFSFEGNYQNVNASLYYNTYDNSIQITNCKVVNK